MSRIQAHEHQLLKIFSDEYAFRIPHYQRPYRWGLEQAELLLKDIAEAAEDAHPLLSQRNEAAIEAISPYFLGSVVLVKPSANPESEVVDGQQRLTTLSLLLAALRATLPAQEADELGELLFEKGSIIKGTKDRCRLTLRPSDHGFYRERVLEDPSLEKLRGTSCEDLPEAQANIIRNGQYFLVEMEKLSVTARSTLATFLLQYTFLVVVTTASLDAAFRIFSVLNDRGLDLTAADILKAEIIGEIPEENRGLYTKKWDDTDASLSGESFDKLISHIVMIHHRQKMKESVLKTFRKVIKAEERPQQFIDDELLPFADAFLTIQNADWEGDRSNDINRTLRQLSRLDNSDWVPPALLILVRQATSGERLARALADLERLAVVLWLHKGKVGVNERIERFGKVVKEILDNRDLTASDSALQLTASEVQVAVDVLNGDIYHLSPKPKRTMILLRLDEALSSGEANYEEKRITIEHVLPQSPEPDSDWLSWWPDESHRQYATHRLGNLALLNGRQNSAARNWELEKKKVKYFTTKGGASPFMITNEVIGHKEWTPTVFDERQKRYVDKLREAWGLGSNVG